MQKLPGELICEIFVACRPWEQPDYGPSPLFPPLLFCQVCSSWRAIAISTPQLWANLTILLCSDLSNWKHARILELWSSRKGAVPATLTFRQRPLDSTNSSTSSDQEFVLSKQLFTHSSVTSARVIAFHKAQFEDVRLLLDILSYTPFPHLEDLVISHCFESRGMQHEDTHRGSSQPHKLKRLFFALNHGPRIDLMLDKRFRTGFDWERLTHLSADLPPTLYSWRLLLHKCTSLTHILVKFHLGFRNDVPSQLERLQMDITHRGRLQEIVLDVSFPDFAPLFDGFRFPSVTKLRVSMGSAIQGETTDLVSLNRMLVSTPNLQELHTQFCFPVGQCSKLPRFLQGHRHGELGSTSMHPEHDELLPLSSLLPELKVLVFDYIDAEGQVQTYMQDLITILKSKWLREGWSTAPTTERLIQFFVDFGFTAVASSEAHLYDFDAEIEANFKYPHYPFRTKCNSVFMAWWKLEEPDSEHGWSQPWGWIL